MSSSSSNRHHGMLKLPKEGTLLTHFLRHSSFVVYILSSQSMPLVLSSFIFNLALTVRVAANLSGSKMVAIFFSRARCR